MSEAALEPKTAAPAARSLTHLPRPLVQRFAASPCAPASTPESVHRTLSSPGRPLDADTRQFMESRFGHDFSSVRIHTDTQAAESARAINAHAYTVGNDIAFSSGRYQPDTQSGRSLLAHELAHTVQQSGLQRKASDLAVDTAPDSRLEREADKAAQSVMEGRRTPIISTRLPTAVISRATTPAPPSKTVVQPVTINSVDNLPHTVSPEGPVPPSSSGARVRKFNVTPFYLPGTKGEGADKRYADYIAAQQLRAVVGFNDKGQPRTELWQSRDRTEVLGESWLQYVGWPVEEKDTRWQAVTGEALAFPKVGPSAESAQIDHIVELQLGGTNNPSNLRPLDKEPNQQSGTWIWQQVSAIAKAIRDEPTFAVGNLDQIELIFTELKPQGVAWSGDYTKKPINALKAHNKAIAGRTDPKDDASTKYIKLSAGANTDDFAVPAEWSATKPLADLNSLAFNKAPSQLISSLKLTAVHYVSATQVGVDAEVDLRNRTRIPLDTKAAAAAAGAAAKLKLTGSKPPKAGSYSLKLPTKPPVIKFDYPYLSPVQITNVAMNESGDLDWKGTLTPSVKLFGALGVEFMQGELKVVKGLEPETLKKASILGFKVTEADVKLTLAPDFGIQAGFKFGMGSGETPVVAGDLSLKKDELGVVGEGNIKLNLPKVKSATSKITYKGGGGRDDWTVELHVQSEDFKLAPGYSLSGKLDAFIDKGELKFSGELSATLPGNNSATLGLRRSPKGTWQLYGAAKFKVPKLNEIEANGTYDLDTDELIVSTKTKTGFNIPVLNLPGHLDNLTVKVSKEGKITVWGKGGLEIKRGKATGHVDVELLPDGHFKGEGSVSYKLREDLTVTGGVIFDENAKPPNPRLRVNGELKLEKLKLFEGVKSDRELFKLSATIPVPGLSAGTSGVVITVGGSLTLGYSFGPGVIAPIIFKAGFNPLDDAPDISLEVTGTLSIPARAYVTAAAFAEAGLQVDALIAKGGIAAGLELSGKIELKGEVFSDLKAAYKASRLTASIVAGLRADLILGIALTAYVRAYAESIIGLGANERWDWVLKQASFPTGLHFEMSAPFGYDSDASPSITLPGLKDVTFIKPEIDAPALIKKVWAGATGNKSQA